MSNGNVIFIWWYLNISFIFMWFLRNVVFHISKTSHTSFPDPVWLWRCWVICYVYWKQETFWWSMHLVPMLENQNKLGCLIHLLREADIFHIEWCFYPLIRHKLHLKWTQPISRQWPIVKQSSIVCKITNRLGPKSNFKN